MRQIAIDTETTGLEPEKGHRIIEIGCIELIDRKITGTTFHRYLNPQREIDDEALAVHKITKDFLLDKPIFSDILADFLEFINGAEIIAHNAPFDVGFINYEINLVNRNNKKLDHYVKVIDTLVLARKKFPGQRNTLDAICKRYQLDLNERKLKGHGALLDAELLARAYLLMTGGQSNLFGELESELEERTENSHKKIAKQPTTIIKASQTELNEHQVLLEKIAKQSKQSIWNQK